MNETRERQQVEEQLVQVSADTVTLEGSLGIPDGAESIILFAHGSGSSRHSPRNRFVAQYLQEAGLATLLIDLLTPAEEDVDRQTGQLRFDVGLLAERLVGATDWLWQYPDTRPLNIGYFGASTGAAAALIAATERPDVVGAIVSRGGRPDLARARLPLVKTPTLLIVGSYDKVVIEQNKQALTLLQTEKQIEIVLGAGHLFEEPGTLEEVARLAERWFQHHLTQAHE